MLLKTDKESIIYILIFEGAKGNLEFDASQIIKYAKDPNAYYEELDPDRVRLIKVGVSNSWSGTDELRQTYGDLKPNTSYTVFSVLVSKHNEEIVNPEVEEIASLLMTLVMSKDAIIYVNIIHKCLIFTYVNVTI